MLTKFAVFTGRGHDEGNVRKLRVSAQAAPVRARALAHTHTHTGMNRHGHATRGHALGHACTHSLGTHDLANDPQLIRLGPVFHVRFRYGGTRHARPHAVAHQGAATTHVNARARIRYVQDAPAPALEQQDSTT